PPPWSARPHVTRTRRTRLRHSTVFSRSRAPAISGVFTQRRGWGWGGALPGPVSSGEVLTVKSHHLVAGSSGPGACGSAWSREGTPPTPPRDHPPGRGEARALTRLGRGTSPPD